MYSLKILLAIFIGLFVHIELSAQFKFDRKLFVDSGWASTSVNTVVFRKNSIVSFENSQYVSYYNKDAFVVVASRGIQKDSFHLNITKLKGNVYDAHNSISLGIDGNMLLKLAWDHHNSPLKYSPGLIKGVPWFDKIMPMTGKREEKVTYTEFYTLPGKRMLFLYRDGASGNGNLAIKRFEGSTFTWEDVQPNLIDGEGKRNAYWQACVDNDGTIHLSWTWRETADVATNHDICYAKSMDAGQTWTKSDGSLYKIPIKPEDAEYVARVPMKSELINQTSITTDENNIPFIASYWATGKDSIPQYHVLYKNGNGWQDINGRFRKTRFSLSGTGTKRIPISRPQVLAWKEGKAKKIAIIFRDKELGGRLAIASGRVGSASKWSIRYFSEEDLGAWEPSYDTELWRTQRRLHLFVQKTGQTDGEKVESIGPQPIWLYELSLQKR